MPRGRCPEGFVDDHRLGRLPGFVQAVEVLMVVKRIAACPINQLYVGIREALAVVIKGRAWALEHIGNARNRNKFVCSSHPLADFLTKTTNAEVRYLAPAKAHIVETAVAVPEPGAR